MRFTLTPVQREILYSALALHKTIAQSTHASLKRLGRTVEPAISAMGANEFIRTSLDNASVGDKGESKVMEINNSTAKDIRVMLAVWAPGALRSSENAKQYTLVTNVGDREHAAQAMLDALNEQLSLDLVNIDQLVREFEPDKPKKETKPKKEPKAKKEKAAKKNGKLPAKTKVLPIKKTAPKKPAKKAAKKKK